jgi:hypothetical protein
VAPELKIHKIQLRVAECVSCNHSPLLGRAGQDSRPENCSCPDSPVLLDHKVEQKTFILAPRVANTFELAVVLHYHGRQWPILFICAPFLTRDPDSNLQRRETCSHPKTSPQPPAVQSSDVVATQAPLDAVPSLNCCRNP